MTDVVYEGKVRARNPDTSWDAAARQTETKIEALRRTIVFLLATGGDMTDEGLVDAYAELRETRPELVDATPQSIRTRRHEALVDGRVRDTGRRARTRSGSTGAIWGITQHGGGDEPTA